MRLYIIRHGQSVNNALWDASRSDTGRSEDPELTEIGHEQARLLGEFIQKTDAHARSNGKQGEPKRDYFGITHLYTSLMVRSVATASYLSKALDLPLLGWPEIHECGGIYIDGENENERIGRPGKSRAFFAEHFAHLQVPESVSDDGWWNNRPFEPNEDRQLRAKGVIQTLLERHGGTNDVVAMVSHGGFYMEIARALFNLGEGNTWFLMQNTAVSRFEFRPGRETVLYYHNRTAHLPDHLIT